MHLELTAITIDYGLRRVMAGVSLTLNHGETLVVAGANGSGKSSLLRVLAGLQRPTSGSVRYHTEAASYRPADALWLVGWVAPDLQLYRELTALENLTFFAALRGLRRTPADLETLLAEVGLGGRGADLLATFSSGMAQRLRYAYAILHDPRGAVARRANRDAR